MNGNINRKHIWECKKLMHNMKDFSVVRKIDAPKNTIEKSIKFNEILCPLTKDKIIVSNCFNCQYCQKMKGSHFSGRSLTSLICLYKSSDEGEFQ